MKAKNIAVIFALLAAALYAINIPASKLLMQKADSTMMAAFLYLGAGAGMLILRGLENAVGITPKKAPLTKKELPFTIAMVVLDIFAPIFLMLGIRKTNSANVALLNNFEIVATSFLALVVFREKISKRLWLAIFLVTAASAVLSFEGGGAFTFNNGSLYVLAACVCWGFENNCTKKLSNKNSQDIVIIKGCFSGLGSFLIALILKKNIPSIETVAVILLLGFISYGLSIHFYIMAQKELGAAKTSAYYSIAPFFGVAFSLLLIGERPSLQFYIALIIMAAATIIMTKDTITLQHEHEHEHTHTHLHCHGDLAHSHEHTHKHSHLHVHKGNSACHTHAHNDLCVHNHTHCKHAESFSK